MGPPNIARVKPSNLYITCLDQPPSVSSLSHVTTDLGGGMDEAHAGTAGAISLLAPCWLGSLLVADCTVAVATFLRVAMMCDM